MVTPSAKKRKTAHAAAAREESTSSTTTCAHQQKPPAKVPIDTHGDLHLQVGVNQCLPESNEDGSKGHGHKPAVIYLVDSRALSRSSSAWRAMLNGAFAESSRPDPNSGEKWTVELPDDDPTPMLIILNIIHNRFDRVPRGTNSMSVEALYDLAVLTDKYDLTRLLLPWAKEWTAPLKVTVGRLIAENPSGLCSTLEKLLWIAWEFGVDQLFNEVYIYLVLNTRTEGEYLVETSSGTQLFSSGILEPSNASDYIKARRQEALSAVLAIYQDGIDGCLGEKATADHWNCRCNDRSRCYALMLGKLMQWLKRGDLWPLPDPTTVSMSLNEIINQAKGCNVLGMETWHRNESCKLFPAMDASLKSITGLIQTRPKLVVHLQSQAKKSGLQA